MICNAGVAYYKASDLPRAHRYLKRCSEVGKALNADFMGNVEKVIAAVEAALAAGSYTPVEVTSEPTNFRVRCGLGRVPGEFVRMLHRQEPDGLRGQTSMRLDQRRLYGNPDDVLGDHELGRVHGSRGLHVELTAPSRALAR